MKLGELIDAQGVETTLDDDELVAGVVVLLKVVLPDGAVKLSLAWSEGMSWLERVGMLRVAEQTECEETP